MQNIPRNGGDQAGSPLPTSVAFYLPQFHPIPENDEWWGDGFTEWVNVRRARPLFAGHLQPKVPGELGYYDLRDPDVRIAQAALARAHEIGGFCYYHYWFNGRRLLETPLTEVLRRGEPDLPFMLCWANENWTRAWDGGARQILIQQHYGVDDDLAHFRHLAEIFEDPRYIRVDGRPVLLVYRAGLLPSPAATAERWAAEADRLGVAAPYLCHVESFPAEERDPRLIGFDAAVEFAPQYTYLPRGHRSNRVTRGLHEAHLLPARYAHHRVDYAQVAARMIAKPPRPYRWHRSVTPAWDNTPRRRSGGLIVQDSTPALFGSWVSEVLRQGRDAQSPLLFINAWNEWAEGAYLEPDEHWGRAYLEAHRDARRLLADPPTTS